MKILKFKAEAYKRLQVVEITPEGNLVLLSGKNGQGKSSCLEAIWSALGGASATPIMPVHQGEERSKVELDLGDSGVELKVRAVCTADGGRSLVVTNNATGKPLPSPQAILDALVGKLTFDPLEFSRQRPTEQYETLRALAGIDLTTIDKQRQEAYDHRTMLGREIKTLEGQLAGLPQHPDAPAEEVSTAEVMQEWRTAEESNKANASKRDSLRLAKTMLERDEQDLGNERLALSVLEDEVRKLQAKIQAKQDRIQQQSDRLALAKASYGVTEGEVAKLQDIDTNPFKSKIHSAETVNRQVRQNQQRAKVSADLSEKRQAHTSLDQKIEDLDVEKRRMISKAKLPIEGLSFEAGRVMLNGIPFSQLNMAEQLKISVAVGIALNPKLRVLLIREGSHLDSDNRRMIAEMADKSGSQVWLEVISADGEPSVIIEDGRVKGAPIPEPVAAEPVEPSAAPPADKPAEAPSTTTPAPKRGRKAKPDQEAFTDIFA